MSINVDEMLENELSAPKRLKIGINSTIANPDVTRHIMKAFNLRASKRLGQNFLVDANIVRGIVEAAGAKPGIVFWK